MSKMIVFLLTIVLCGSAVMVDLDLANSDTEKCVGCDSLLATSTATTKEILDCLIPNPTDCAIAYTTAGLYAIDEICHNSTQLTLLFPGGLSVGVLSFDLSVASGVPDECVVEVIEHAVCGSAGSGRTMNIQAGSQDTLLLASPALVLEANNTCATQLTTDSLAVSISGVGYGYDIDQVKSATFGKVRSFVAALLVCVCINVW
eukprot:Blabericola_migrator_1__9022@NODE_47_length_16538_cov_123_101147_g43_i0_p9_GENE_NODE_47_length_16538_cov_123_101147_g43_i0NODE_47_length_16538_cov_123_101147_g43_i0_p9_ORF_typecomplete_len203_score31_07_NODE_47_length_16538_cov_123_101147_g43_i014202028